MKNFKWLIVGIIIGSIISASTFTLADTIKQYIGVPVTFPVYVDGKEYAPTRPFLAIEGTTYVPLVEVGNIVGADVKWNNELKRVDVITPNNRVGEVNNGVTNNEVYIKLIDLNNLINPDNLFSNLVILGVKDVKQQLFYLKYKENEIVFNGNLTKIGNDPSETYINIDVVKNLFDESVINQLTTYIFN